MHLDHVIKTPKGQTYHRNRAHLTRVSNDNKKASLTIIDDDYLSDDPCNEHEDNTNNTSTTETNADDIQPLQTNPPVLQRSQRTIRKPERYYDSNY